jgi:hypothetical protein
VPIRKNANHPPFKNSGLFFIVSMILLFACAAVLSEGGNVQAEQVTLAWDPNTESNLAGYRIHLGTAAHAYNSVIDVGNQTHVTVTNLNRGTTYFFSVTAYNTQGQESDYSNEVAKTVVKQYQLTVGKRGSGLGTVVGEGINCGAECRGVYDEGSQVNLSVNPDNGSVFTGWSGDDCSGIGDCVLTMGADKSLTAGLLGHTNGVAKKNRNAQLAANGINPTPGTITGRAAIGSRETRTTVLTSSESNSPYYVIRRTDRRGNTSGFTTLSTSESGPRSRYAAH